MSRGRAPPRRSRGLIWRGLLAGVLISLCTAGAVGATGLLQVEDILDTLRAQGRAAIEIPEIDRADAGKAQTLMILGSDRPLRRQEGRAQAALGHDDPRPAGPGQGGDRDDVDPARPAGRHPGRRQPGEDQRRVRELRRARRGPRGQEPAVGRRADVPDQPRGDGRLRRLPARDRLHRLRVRRHRPRLLQRRDRPGRLRRDRHRPRLPEAVRDRRARATSATATATTTSCAPRASRTSCARCAARRGRRS